MTASLLRTVLASCASGLLLGVGARLTMRVIALQAGVAPGFSLGGSLEVVATGAFAGIPVALVFFAIRRRVATVAPWPGVLCGLLVFGALATFPPPAARSALAGTPLAPRVAGLSFGALFVLWGLSLDYVARGSVDRSAGHARTRTGAAES